MEIAAFPSDEAERLAALRGYALLFHDFAQVHTEDDGEYGGAGLGLAISRRFARLMGGELTAESERGRGSRFTLRIPTAPADQPQSTIVTL